MHAALRIDRWCFTPTILRFVLAGPVMVVYFASAAAQDAIHCSGFETTGTSAPSVSITSCATHQWTRIVTAVGLERRSTWLLLEWNSVLFTTAVAPDAWTHASTAATTQGALYLTAAVASGTCDLTFEYSAEAVHKLLHTVLHVVSCSNTLARIRTIRFVLVRV